VSYLNEDQQDWVDYITSNPDIRCGCGWYTKNECWTICNSKEKQRPEELAVSKAILWEREKCAKIADQYARNNYPLKDTAENYDSNRLRRNDRFTANMIAYAIRREKYSSDIDFYAVPDK
jgi:hypothetical protein